MRAWIPWCVCVVLLAGCTAPTSWLRSQDPEDDTDNGPTSDGQDAGTDPDPHLDDHEDDPSASSPHGPPTLRVLQAQIVAGCGYDDPRYDCHHFLIEVDATATGHDVDPGAWQAEVAGEAYDGLKQAGPDHVAAGDTATLEIRVVTKGGSDLEFTTISGQDFATGSRMSTSIPSYADG